MKSLSQIHPATQEGLGKSWRNLVSSFERWLMQKNRGKTQLARQIRCRAKIFLIRILEKTY